MSEEYCAGRIDECILTFARQKQLDDDLEGSKGKFRVSVFLISFGAIVLLARCLRRISVDE